LTSAFLISITTSPVIVGLLGRLSFKAKQEQLKARSPHYYLWNTLYLTGEEDGTTVAGSTGHF
jgi:hypothetical protein